MRFSQRYKRFYDDRYYWSTHEYKPSQRNKFKFAGSNAKSKNADPFRIIQRRLNWLRRVENKRIGMYSSELLCPSGNTRSQGWTALFRAWTGFIIKKQEGDEEGMHYYAMGIRRLEKDLGLSVYEFKDLKIAALEFMNEEENHPILQEKAEQLHKELDELSSQEILDIMLEQDRKAYELLNNG